MIMLNKKKTLRKKSKIQNKKTMIKYKIKKSSINKISIN